jgi:tRNA-dihydrouridine synthase 3
MITSFSEMVFARNLIKGEKSELARLRRSTNETHFGVQIATNNVTEGRRAVELAAQHGAEFVDINCGCPIHEATRRGLGSSLLRNPNKLHHLVKGLADSSPIPVSVKLRTAADGSEINIHDTVAAVISAGASAVTIHGRTSSDRYSNESNWELIGDVVKRSRQQGAQGARNPNSPPIVGPPIVGNGDVLTHFEAERRIHESGVDGVMVGRGALNKPWLFQEYNNSTTFHPADVERVAIYRRLACYMKEHFGDDDRGRKKAWYFLPWHFEFFCRYRPYSEEAFGERRTPLLLTRLAPLGDDASLLDRLLDHSSTDLHAVIAAELWASTSDDDAVKRLTVLAGGSLSQFGGWSGGGGEHVHAGDTEELSNISSEDDGKKRQRKKKGPPKPIRTEKEIEELRRVRAKKRAESGAPPHVQGY